MDPGLLIAQVEHGPQMHGPALLILMAFVLVAGLVALVRKAMARKRLNHDRVIRSDLDPVNGADRDPVSDRGEKTRTPSGGRSG
jgi:hypothetical protein